MFSTMFLLWERHKTTLLIKEIGSKKFFLLPPLQTKEAQLMVAEMELSKVDNKAKLETTLQEEAAIEQDNKDREMERLADAAEKAARVTTDQLCLLFTWWFGRVPQSYRPVGLCVLCLVTAGGGAGVRSRAGQRGQGCSFRDTDRYGACRGWKQGRVCKGAVCDTAD